MCLFSDVLDSVGTCELLAFQSCPGLFLTPLGQTLVTGQQTQLPPAGRAWPSSYCYSSVLAKVGPGLPWISGATALPAHLSFYNPQDWEAELPQAPDVYFCFPFKIWNPFHPNPCLGPNTQLALAKGPHFLGLWPCVLPLGYSAHLPMNTSEISAAATHSPDSPWGLKLLGIFFTGFGLLSSGLNARTVPLNSGAPWS